MSPSRGGGGTSCSSPIPAKFLESNSDVAMPTSDTPLTTSLMRKPILQGKIDSRAVVGMKQS